MDYPKNSRNAPMTPKNAPRAPQYLPRIPQGPPRTSRGSLEASRAPQTPKDPSGPCQKSSEGTPGLPKVPPTVPHKLFGADFERGLGALVGPWQSSGESLVMSDEICFFVYPSVCLSLFVCIIFTHSLICQELGLCWCPLDEP